MLGLSSRAQLHRMPYWWEIPDTGVASLGIAGCLVKGGNKNLTSPFFAFSPSEINDLKSLPLVQDALFCHFRFLSLLYPSLLIICNSRPLVTGPGLRSPYGARRVEISIQTSVHIVLCAFNYTAEALWKMLRLEWVPNFAPKTRRICCKNSRLPAFRRHLMFV
jgi:hypothetical protein